MATFRAFVSENPDYHICFVNDGSTDESARVLSEFCATDPEHFSLLNLERNSGKGEAVRKGMLRLIEKKTLETIGFLDADLSTPLSEYRMLNDTLLKGSHQAVFGSRFKRIGSNIDRSVKRHIIGRFFATLISKIIKLPFYDTQCGAKVFFPQILEGVLKDKFLTKWLFDVEIIIRLERKYGLEAVQSLVLEEPLNVWVEKGDSRITKGDIVRIPLDLIRIKRHYK